MKTVGNSDPNLVQALERVFLTGDPRVNRFTPNVARRALLFPVEYHLSDDWFDAVRAGALLVGDRTAFFGWSEGKPGSAPPEATLLELKFAAYLETALEPLQTFLISPTGAWGLKMTDERVALVGGSEDFVDAVFRGVGEPPEVHAQRFAEFVSHDPTIELWANGLLAHIQES
jgi:hypothetical protein